MRGFCPCSTTMTDNILDTSFYRITRKILTCVIKIYVKNTMRRKYLCVRIRVLFNVDKSFIFFINKLLTCAFRVHMGVKILKFFETSKPYGEN